MSKKPTIAETLIAIATKYAEVMTEDEVKFLTERAEKANAKNASRKPSKHQTENAEIKERILAFMEPDKAYTIGEIQKAVGLDTNQRTSALVRQLKDEDKVVRSVEKGKAYFTKL